MTIAENEILDELRKSMGQDERPAGFYSCIEMAEELGCSLATVQRQMKKWKAENRLEMRVTRIQNTSGHSVPIPTYRLRPAVAKPKARRAK